MANTERKIDIEIRAKTEKAISEINRLNRELNNLKKNEKNFKAMDSQVKQMSRSFSSLATHVAKLAVIYGAFEGLNNTVRTFAKFEDSMTRLGVISGATAEELALLDSKAQELGATTIYSASQVADGMNSMAMAGLSADEQLVSIGSTLDLATIGMISLEDASLIAVRTMGSFGKEAKDIANITDVMATGATNSAQTIEELGSAYEKVGSVATAFNISLDETTASLMVMADAGRKGTEAGTQLKIVMSRLAGNKEAKKYLDELGISMYDANGQLLPFTKQLELLKKALDKLPESQRNIKLGQIVGEEGKATSLILMNNVDKLHKNISLLENSFGSASEKAKALQDTLIGGYKALLSALESLAIKVGTVLTPALDDMLLTATQGIRQLNDADIEEFANNIKDLIEFVTSLSKAVGSLLSTLASFTQTISDLTGISTGWVAIIGVVAVKMRTKLIPAIIAVGTNLKALALANPYLFALEAGLIAIDLALAHLQAEIDKTNKITEDFTKTFKGLSELLDGALLAKDTMDGEAIRVTLKAISDESDKTRYEIIKLKKELAEEQDSWFVDDEKVDDLKNKINLLERSLQNAKATTDELKKKGIELTKAQKDLGTSTDDLKNKQKSLSDAQKKTLDSSISNMDNRKKSLETTLTSMLQKEQGYYDKIADLEAKTAEIRKKYADERVNLQIDVDNRLANARNKGLSDYQVYVNSQQRADEAYAKAKDYLAKGNLELAKKYLDEYSNLIEVSAGEEITEKEKVRKYNADTHKFELEDVDKVRLSRNQSLAEYESDMVDYQTLYQQWLDKNEAKEQEANNAKIEYQKTQLALLQAQMEVQRNMLEAVNELISLAGGIKLNFDYGNFDQVMARTESELKAMEDKQRHIKIDGIDTSKVKSDYQKLDSEKPQPTIEPDIDEKPYINFKKTVVNDELVIKTKADLAQANADVARLQAEVEKQGVKPVDANTVRALAKARQLQAELSQSVTKMVYIQEQYLPARHQTGGFILPRFADGGSPSSLDNGVGHSRKSGALGGYGGGDKIKALLEAGEFVVRKEAVSALGLDRLNMINQGQLPRYQYGGGVSIPRFNSGGAVTTSSAEKSVELNLNIGNNSYKTYTNDEVANALAEELKRSSF